jgi:hypothetical protein
MSSWSFVPFPRSMKPSSEQGGGVVTSSFSFAAATFPFSAAPLDGVYHALGLNFNRGSSRASEYKQ